ncbi:hypothetical protein LXL04_034834 [Taraxacum kok-saghyz]
MEDEFRGLQKGSQTISQYSKQFMEKLGFLKHIAPDEENKIKFYLKGLLSDMKAFVRNAHVSTLEKAIEESHLLEDDLTPIKDEKFTGDKRRWEAPNRNVKRFHPNSGARKFEAKREFGICPRCNKRHTGNCYSTSVVCNKCGKPCHTIKDCRQVRCYTCGVEGHISYNCPKLKEARKEPLANQPKKD